MTSPIPAAVIDGPTWPLAQFGLFAAAAGPVPLTGHQRAGVLYEVLCDSTAHVWPVLCVPETPPSPKAAPGPPDPGSVTGTPFGVYAVEDCLMGRSPDEIQARAIQRLELGEQHTVERAFWLGSDGNLPALATSTPTIISGGPMSLVRAVAELEQWLGDNSPVGGIIHAQRRVAAYAKHYALTDRAGPRLETPLGNAWAFGAGYTTAGPAGQPAAAAGQAWLYVTRPVTIRRTEISVPAGVRSGGVNVAQNSAFVVAERLYVLDYACQTAAALVDLTACSCVVT